MALRSFVTLTSISVFCISAMVACAAPAGEDASAPDSSEQAFSVNIPESERFLAKAVEEATLHASGGCEHDAYRSTIVDFLRKAVAVRDTVYFRTQVIGTKAILAQELAGTLEWQEILGTYNPKNLKTLPAALVKGVSLWDTSGGVYGNRERVEFRANGVAVVYVLNTDDIKNIHWDSSNTTWRYSSTVSTAGTITLGTGIAYDVTIEDGLLWARATNAGTLISQQSECEA
jgi:hypothetical protein